MLKDNNSGKINNSNPTMFQHYFLPCNINVETLFILAIFSKILNKMEWDMHALSLLR